MSRFPQDRFDGSDTQRLLAEFNGNVQKLPTHSPVTGNMRFYQKSQRRKLEEEGVDVYDMPYYLLSYTERKEQERRQEAAKARKGH